MTAPPTGTLTLWYDRPASDWESEALPIGNGALGAMIFGGIGQERVQFNEKSLWTGGPGEDPAHTGGVWESPRPTALAEARRLQVLAEGGTRTDAADHVTVTAADAVTLLLTAGTDHVHRLSDYKGDHPHARVTARLDAAAAKPYGRLLARHEADYRELFGRVRLDLGQRPPTVPTDQLLKAYTGGSSPSERALEALMFAYGRYLLISSSRAGSLPANLQGVWNKDTSAAWSGDYHPNINPQMNYWPAEVTNLTETTGPLFEFIDGLRPRGRQSAKVIFDADGWVVNNETNAFDFTGVHDWPTAFWFPEAAAWLTRHLWEHYEFTGDRAFLRSRAYPIMREAAEFWLDFLVADPRDGTLVAVPSYSPEHGKFTAATSMSQQIVWDLFTNVLAAGKVHGGDTAFRAGLGRALSKLDPGLRVGSWGQLQEWKEDLDDPADTHRHVSHLYALHPGSQISPVTTPAYAQAAKVSLTAREGDGSGWAPGWSRSWKTGFMARGCYTRTVIAAWDWRNGAFTRRWTFDSSSSTNTGRGYDGQGNHQLSVADVDQDGRDEIVYGAMAVDDNGNGLWTTRNGHGDAMHVGDLNPSRSGLEVFKVGEDASKPSSWLADARTGQILWSTPASGDNGRGVSGDIWAGSAGAESWSAAVDGVRSPSG
ncbi:glycoside hydrolase N-terminal domain-containing protein [Actinomadura sp. HBU206391]|nr:glycoside hydrolase N-terminal domain-containing protein [Actinomadura sp. HBU206391]MBC6463684.1 glycoside hydrolase N-terminal domain-containing protein [Actinomadura sp. HBU206391]